MSGKGRRRGRVWGTRIALVVASLLTVEGGFRLFLWARGAPHGAAEVAADLRRSMERFGGDELGERLRAREDAPPNGEAGRFSHPFYGWETLRSLEELERHYAAGRDDDAFEIWIVGGSVADYFARSENGPRRLREVLAESPRLGGRRLELRNYARPAFKQPQQVNVVGYLLSLGLAPDAVINLDGFNEVAIGTSNDATGTHPSYPSISMWGALQVDPRSDAELEELWDRIVASRERARRWGERALAWGLYRSSVLGWGAVRYLQGCRRDWKELTRSYADALRERRKGPLLRGPRAPDGDPMDVIVTGWLESSRSLDALLEPRSIFYLHVLQPTLHDPGSKPLSAEEAALPPLNAHWLRGIREGYPRLRAAAPTLESWGIAFEDASDVFADVEETVYFDAIHFGEEGAALLAERIARAFLAALPAD